MATHPKLLKPLLTDWESYFDIIYIQKLYDIPHIYQKCPITIIIGTITVAKAFNK